MTLAAEARRAMIELTMASDEPSLGEAGEWFLERGAEGATSQHRHGTADVTVRGPATTLLLVLTRRRSIFAGLDNSPHASGDLGLFTHWIANTAHQAGQTEVPSAIQPGLARYRLPCM